MAAKPNTQSDAIAIAKALMSGNIATDDNGSPLRHSVGDRIADRGGLLASIRGGLTAARANYAVELEAERDRQTARTAERVARMLAQKKQLGL